MSGVVDLVEFLHDRLREDEHAALAAASQRDPARPLADVEAKRRIVDLHGGEPYPNPGDELVDTECTSFGADLRYPEQCATLRLLALPYADHDDYQGAWKP